jgi:6-pyruvoyltetrahydropterin/6-carboxytetrahydropterin synthase
MVVTMAAMDETVRSRVLDRFDHTNLNLDPLFVNRVPTTENLSKAIFELLDGGFAPATLAQVRVEETENNFFECTGD